MKYTAKSEQDANRSSNHRSFKYYGLAEKRLPADFTINLVAIFAIAIVSYATVQSALA